MSTRWQRVAHTNWQIIDVWPFRSHIPSYPFATLCPQPSVLKMHLFTSVAIFSLIGPVLVQAQYSLLTDYFASDFFGQFDFFDGADPTHGSVLYQGRDDSLISSSSNNAQMHVSTEQSTPNGRPSIRLTSKESYQSGLIVVDVAHMPGGICGTW